MKNFIIISLFLPILACQEFSATEDVNPSTIIAEESFDPLSSVGSVSASQFHKADIRPIGLGLLFYGSGGGGSYDYVTFFNDNFQQYGPDAFQVVKKSEIKQDKNYVGVGIEDPTNGIDVGTTKDGMLSYVVSESVTEYTSTFPGEIEGIFLNDVSAFTGLAAIGAVFVESMGPSSLVEVAGAMRGVSALDELTFQTYLNVNDLTYYFYNDDQHVQSHTGVSLTDLQNNLNDFPLAENFKAVGLTTWIQQGDVLGVGSIGNVYDRAYRLGQLIDQYKDDPDMFINEIQPFKYYKGTIEAFRLSDDGTYGALTVNSSAGSMVILSGRNFTNIALFQGDPATTYYTGPTLISYLIDLGDGNGFLPYTNLDISTNIGGFKAKDIYVILTCDNAGLYNTTIEDAYISDINSNPYGLQASEVNPKDCGS